MSKQIKLSVVAVLATSVLAMNGNVASAQSNSSVLSIKSNALTTSPLSQGIVLDVFGQNKPSVTELETKALIASLKEKAKAEEAEKSKAAKETPKPQPEKYVVKEGDTLTSISEEKKVDWIRIWQKNEVLKDQDVLNVGQELLIPLPNETLAEKPLIPHVAPQTAVTSDSTQPSIRSYSPQRTYYGNSDGNLYAPGYCTWYVKNRRPDLPNNLGNAGSWYGNAQSMGLATGTAPAPGAVGVSFEGSLGHVVYVESVSGGMVNISEMNYSGLYRMNSRTVPASNFVYIY